MGARFGIFSIPLLCLVLLLGYKNYEIRSDPPPWAPKKAGPKKTENKSEAPALARGAAAAGAAPESLQIVSEKNIFTPDRKEFPTQAAAAEQAKPVVRPQVVLYGVMIADEHQTASIANPGRPLFKGERETKTVKVGERIGEYSIAKILPDRITLEASGDSFEVLLFDPKTPKKRTEVRTAAKPPEPAPRPGGGPPAATAPASGPSSPPGPAPAAAKMETAPPQPVPQVPQAPNPNLWRNRRAIRPPAPVPGPAGQR